MGRGRTLTIIRHWHRRAESIQVPGELVELPLTGGDAQAGNVFLRRRARELLKCGGQTGDVCRPRRVIDLTRERDLDQPASAKGSANHRLAKALERLEYTPSLPYPRLNTVRGFRSPHYEGPRDRRLKALCRVAFSIV